MTEAHAHWYDALASIDSLGKLKPRPGSLAGLAARRKETLSQFFTSRGVARLMWAIASPAMERAIARCPGSKVAVLDNSIGSGRLVSHADPDRHFVLGNDVHRDSAAPLAAALRRHGFDCDIRIAGMQAVRVFGRCGVAVINPPFSVHLSSPTLEPFPCTTFGRHGPNTAAMSHRYALDQALAASDIVIALLPRTFAEELLRNRPARLCAFAHLPDDAFAEEGCTVSTSLLVFGRDTAPDLLRDLTGLSADDMPDLGLDCDNTAESIPYLSVIGEFAARPTIHTPVTGDDVVRVVHDGRRLGLRFACGLVEARCLNALLERPVQAPTENHRYPKSVRFKGDGLFDLECHLAQPDPLASFDQLLARIRAAGGQPRVDPGVRGYLARRIRQDARARIPFRHVVFAPRTADAMAVRPTQIVRVDPNRWLGPVFRPTETYAAARDGDQVIVEHPSGARGVYPRHLFDASFQVVTQSASEWQIVHPGRIETLPLLARQIRLEMARRGVDRVVSWDYQAEDTIELLMGRNAIGALSMGLGKTRVAIALALMGGRANVIVLEAQLIDEFVRELVAVGVPASDWQVIESPNDARNLRRINVISVVRLRMPIAEGSRRTIACMLRRRVATLIVDEAQMLRNPDTDRSRAIAKISPKRRFGLTGTPIVNYGRDLTKLMQWAHGDGTALQPYGRHRPYLRPELVDNMDTATTGARHWMDNHAVLTWVTHKFEVSGLVTGAKREIPTIRGIDQVREWVAPLMKRRLSSEPDVAKHFRSPEYDVVHHAIPFDPPHLAHVLRVADDFAAWWREQRRMQNETGKNISIVTVLARVGALERAVTYPQFGTEGFGAYLPLSSKQRALIARLAELAGQGKKAVCYVANPGMADLLVQHLRAQGVDAIPFHGEMPIVERTRLLNDRFRFGDCPIMVAALGVTQTGLNLYQASHAIFACYGWSSAVIRQAMARLLRPQQTERVQFEFMALEGSIDTYQRQACDWKGDTSDAVLDFLAQAHSENEFKHMDQILDDFVRSLAERHSMTPREFREQLVAHA